MALAHAEQATVWIGMTTPTGGEREGIYRATLDEQTDTLDRPLLAAEIRQSGVPGIGSKGQAAVRGMSSCERQGRRRGV